MSCGAGTHAHEDETWACHPGGRSFSRRRGKVRRPSSDGPDSPRRFARGLGWPLAIGLLGLALRFVYVLEFAGHPVGRLPWGDEGAYWARALEIREGRWLPAEP